LLTLQDPQLALLQLVPVPIDNFGDSWRVLAVDPDLFATPNFACELPLAPIVKCPVGTETWKAAFKDCSALYQNAADTGCQKLVDTANHVGNCITDKCAIGFEQAVEAAQQALQGECNTVKANIAAANANCDANSLSVISGAAVNAPCLSNGGCTVQELRHQLDASCQQAGHSGIAVVMAAEVALATALSSDSQAFVGGWNGDTYGDSTLVFNQGSIVAFTPGYWLFADLTAHPVVLCRC